MERAWHCRKCPGVFCNTLIWLCFSAWWHFLVCPFCRSQGCGAQVSPAYTTCAAQCQGVLAPQIEDHTEIAWQRVCYLTLFVIRLFSKWISYSCISEYIFWAVEAPCPKAKNASAFSVPFIQSSPQGKSKKCWNHWVIFVWNDQQKMNK